MNNNSASATMSDIARHLGIGRSTVSMALRNHPEISRRTRERVMTAAVELGYRANPLVTALMENLRSSRRPTALMPLALIHEYAATTEWRRIPLLGRLLEGLDEQAARAGYRLQEFRLGADGLSSSRLASVLKARGIAGAVLAPLPRSNASHFTEISELATVAIGWSVSDYKGHRASYDHFRNMLLAWDTLRSRGYRRIGFIHTTEQSRWSGLTYLGGFLSRNDKLPPSERTAPLPVETADAMTPQLFRAWFERETPDAVIVTNADSFVPIAQQQASGSPALAIVALETGAAPPGTAGIDEQSAQVGAAAIDLLVKQLNLNQRGLPEVPSVVSLPGQWREGETVRPA